MAFIDLNKNEIQAKIVYYGPGRGGKTTNLLFIHESMSKQVCGKMVTIDTKGDRTLFFDFLPLSIGKILNLSIRIQLYTVPGQVMYNTTRKLVLRGVDGVAFVADSLRVQKQKNVESLLNLAENLTDEGLDIHDIPLVLQYNKRDLMESNIPLLSVEEMQEDLNKDLKVPAFEASAMRGNGVYETLREISKRTIKNVIQKVGGDLK
ncbi:GTP-binding protein [Syntrophobacter fumaroxidans]|mgnify:CR=1 FL=1|uniref:Gliding motility protein (MglA) n=1 Tax=Syntrophobacter fumaroxidans (strain DSM 10017 / MPOB) TaxID=335543 RepID=A0LF17_SYNFM|nr:ADP-ribosylation factor-like protein [Syntrophobacter fumaroxidans]ABK16019.1 gliding motility protein (MglA) [Syntrophobacter fumaroxidans MPOB]HOI93191.1 ADP-ribosylation factor-like protein [Syntrophobacter fumaroxidans]